MDGVCDWLGFVFQAEDVIRDRVRSRVLGDVYKRQSKENYQLNGRGMVVEITDPQLLEVTGGIVQGTVSYTHLTLPTNYSV